MDTFAPISVEDAHKLLSKGNVTLVDIRDRASFAVGHIEGAQHIDSDNLQTFIQAADLDSPLIVYCYHGHSSQPAAQYMLEQGFDEVYSLIGGYVAWEKHAMHRQADRSA
jgi:thiosulfate sulfurtransferase